ncbi:MAG: T9SS type A sorting domain-containing protein [Lewinellaceae bacterium]|nr:T9SS type A sorting domain-containing protein [Lewinellaceae bacterium]
MKRTRLRISCAIVGIFLVFGAIVGLTAQSIKCSVTGRVFLDTLENCAYDVGEPWMPNTSIILELVPSGAGGTVVSPFAVIQIYVPPGDTLARVYAQGLNHPGGSCTLLYEFSVPGDQDIDLTAYFPVQAVDCPQLRVDISGPTPQPCLIQPYSVRSCNYGLSEAEDVYTEVQLDPRLTFQSSSIPATPLPDNRWRFELGTIQSFDCSAFTISCLLDCAVAAGEVVCSEARIFPDTVCLPDTSWNGARVLAQAICSGDSVHFTLTNQSLIPTAPALDYIIAEDLIMYRQDVYQLGAGDSVKFSVEANGATWHLRARQQPGYPGGWFTNATIEGCGTNPSTGIFLQYPFSAGQFNRSRECQAAQLTNSANDVTAFPIGYGSAHLIERGNELEYLVQFQNTGTDTAHTLEIRIALPAGLDPGSVIPGASSHPYTFSQNQNGLLRFVYEAINLPDSTVNPANSRGFVSYRAWPLPDIPSGSVISGNAEIYFDTLPPISTNTVFHTIEEAFLASVLSTNPVAQQLKLEVFPNPASRYVQFQCGACGTANWQVNLVDMAGRMLKTTRATGNQADLDCQDLPAGLYFFQVRVEDQLVSTGKLIVN